MAVGSDDGLVRRIGNRMTLDDLRAARPELGLALYAYTPGGDVTLEVHSDGEVYSFTAATEAEAIEKAFPAPAVSQAPASGAAASSSPAGLAKDVVVGAAETADVFS
jgi:hypothetical protein